jgi:hypothetical protein
MRHQHDGIYDFREGFTDLYGFSVLEGNPRPGVPVSR